MENLYNVLGVAPNASDDEIKKVYRSLAMRYHPDRNDAPGAEVRFKSITKAYEILSDRAKRDEYNQSVNHRIILDAEAEALQPEVGEDAVEGLADKKDDDDEVAEEGRPGRDRMNGPHDRRFINLRATER